jgi:Flp pilus assembly pilin Flp
VSIIYKRLRNFRVDEDGPTTTEYGILITLLIIVALSAISAFGGRVTNLFTDVASAMPAQGDVGNNDGNNGDGSGNDGENADNGGNGGGNDGGSGGDGGNNGSGNNGGGQGPPGGSPPGQGRGRP